VSLGIGLKVAALLRSRGFKVLLTRDADKTVSLAQRVNTTNAYRCADLLISIHANSSQSGMASGIETFCLKQSLFAHRVSMLPTQYRSIVTNQQTARYAYGNLLAESLQKNIVGSVQKINPSVVDRAVKYAVAQMLLGIDIPGALIEVGFLTNKKEAKLLGSTDYHRMLARGIVRGIVLYFKHAQKSG